MTIPSGTVLAMMCGEYAEKYFYKDQISGQASRANQAKGLPYSFHHEAPEGQRPGQSSAALRARLGPSQIRGLWQALCSHSRSVLMTCFSDILEWAQLDVQDAFGIFKLEDNCLRLCCVSSFLLPNNAISGKYTHISRPSGARSHHPPSRPSQSPS